MQKDWKTQIKQRKTRLPHVHCKREWEDTTTTTKKNRFNTHEKWLQHDEEHKYRRHLAHREWWCINQEAFLTLWTMCVHNCCMYRAYTIGCGLCFSWGLVGVAIALLQKCQHSLANMLSFWTNRMQHMTNGPKKNEKEIDKPKEKRKTRVFFLWTKKINISTCIYIQK